MDMDAFQQAIIAQEQARKDRESLGQLQLAQGKLFNEGMSPGSAAWASAWQNAYNQGGQMSMAKYKADREYEMALRQLEMEKHKFDRLNPEPTPPPARRPGEYSPLMESLLGE
jgi:hypothetical protein